MSVTHPSQKEASPCRQHGSVKVPKAHVERLENGTEVKLEVFLSNTKTRRANLIADKLAVLAGLGLEWAATEGAA